MTTKSEAAAVLGSIKSERKAASSAANGKKGGRPTLWDQAVNRMLGMNMNSKRMAFIFSDWPNANEHARWLLKATYEEIVSWGEAANWGKPEDNE